MRRRALAALAAALLASGVACRGASAPAAARADAGPVEPSRPAGPPAALSQLDWPSGARDWLVERVIDGDTLVLAGGERIRLLGIDTLELKHPDPRVHELATAARDELARLTLGQRVQLRPGQDPPARDRYDRVLAYVWLTDGPTHDVGARLLAAGLARPYPSAHQSAAAYREIAFDARRRGVGLWRTDVAAVLGLEPEEDISCSEAGAHVGRLIRVRGRLFGTSDAIPRRGPKVHVVPLRDAGCSLPLVIFPSRYDEMPEAWLQALDGDIEVTGRISLHRGGAQIILEDPFQLEQVPND